MTSRAAYTHTRRVIMRVLVQVFMLVLGTASALFAQQQGTGRGTAPRDANRPLIIVDGVIVSDVCEAAGRARDANVRINGADVGRIAGLTGEEIESVEVLKGNAAAAAYGAGAVNGVIRITTKKGNHYCIDQAPALDAPFARHLFAPDLIMAHQSELGLQDAQRRAIVDELERAQASFVELQWKLSAESEQLETLLRPASVNEALVLAQIDRVLAAEREIKRAQVGLLIRIKNSLSPQQQAKLAELRAASR
jgi:TonB-dependent SusC/RagA subfamily outer membrane receptor